MVAITMIVLSKKASRVRFLGFMIRFWGSVKFQAKTISLPSGNSGGFLASTLGSSMDKCAGGSLGWVLGSGPVGPGNVADPVCVPEGSGLPVDPDG